MRRRSRRPPRRRRAGPSTRRRSLGGGQAEADGPPGLDGELGRRPIVVDGHRDGSRQPERHGAAARHDPPADGGEARRGQAVLEARCELGDHAHLALEALDEADQHVRGAQADVVAADAGLQGEDVGDRHRALRRAPHRPHSQRLADVGALRRSGLGRARLDGPQGPVPGPRVQQPTEDRRRVEPRVAPPVHGPVTGHQGGAVAVRQQRVVGNRGPGHQAVVQARRWRAVASGRCERGRMRRTLRTGPVLNHPAVTGA